MEKATEVMKTVPFALPRMVMTVIALAGMMMAAPALQAQKGGGGGMGGGMGGGKNGGDSTQGSKQDQNDINSQCPEIVGNHKLLEKMASDLKLTCDQQDRIEPLLHGEESVSKPLLAWAALTTQEKDAMILTIKQAERAQIRPLLTPEQQNKYDAEAARLSASEDKELKKSRKEKANSDTADAFAGEEALSDALLRYTALTRNQQKAMLLEVKTAARRSGAPPLTAQQAVKIDGDIATLQSE